MADLPELMLQASQEMIASLAKTRAALTHSLSKGEAAEESLRRFLRAHMPDSIGVTKGQGVDSRGWQTRQLDVILYDKLRTPMLFTSDEGDQQLVPAEGIIAVVEVKTTLSMSSIPDVMANMSSVKQLLKIAYFTSEQEVIRNTFTMYGEALDTFPIMHFLFAYESSNLDTLAQRMAQENQARSIKDRVDCVCILDKGVMINHSVVNGVVSIDGIPSPVSSMLAYPTQNALLLWYLLIAAYILQAHHRPIRLQEYVTSGFTY